MVLNDKSLVRYADDGRWPRARRDSQLKVYLIKKQYGELTCFAEMCAVFFFLSNNYDFN